MPMHRIITNVYQRDRNESRNISVIFVKNELFDDVIYFASLGGGGQNSPHPVSLSISKTNADNDTKLAIPFRATILHIVSKN